MLLIQGSTDNVRFQKTVKVLQENGIHPEIADAKQCTSYTYWGIKDVRDLCRKHNRELTEEQMLEILVYCNDSLPEHAKSAWEVLDERFREVLGL